MPSAAHDVVIVGGGPTGLVLACLLAARGIDVVVLERRAVPGARNRAIGIHAAALDVLDAVGIGAPVRAEAAVITRGVANCRGRRLGEVDLGDAAILTLPQPRTEALLAARLEQLAPGALHRGEAVTALRAEEECVHVRSETAAGDVVSRDARYLIGADGTRSMVRTAIGADWRRRGRPSYYAMADETASASGLTVAELHLEPGGVVERFPLPAGARRWVVRLPRRVAELDRWDFTTLVMQRLGVGPSLAALTPPVPFTAHQHLARPLTRGRIALLGDAAHELSPIGGQGMNLGWLDAAALDEDLALALSNGARPVPFTSYGRRRSAAVRAMRRAGWNTALGAPARGLRLLVRNAFIRMLASRPLQPVARAVVTIRR